MKNSLRLENRIWLRYLKMKLKIFILFFKLMNLEIAHFNTKIQKIYIDTVAHRYILFL